jgi:uncharacterized lipoprotein
MRTILLLSALMLAGITGCDQRQGQLLAMRDDFQKQLTAKEKTIEELNAKVTELDRQNGDLQLQVAKASQDPDKIAEAVSKRVEEKNAAAFGDLKTRLDQLAQSLRGGGNSGASGGVGLNPAPAGGRDPGVRPTSRPGSDAPTPSSGSGNPKIKFNF